MMLRLCCSLLLFMLPVCAYANINAIRRMYQEGVENADQTKSLMVYLDKQPSGPLVKGYKGCATMLMAKHAYSPLSKFRLFNKGKALLESAINADGNTELRYLRFTIQSNAPAFLGYNGQLHDDKSFLIEKLRDGSVTDPELYGMIKDCLQHSPRCTAAEKKLLNNLP